MEVRKISNVKLRQSESSPEDHSMLASLWPIYSILSMSRRLQCTLATLLVSKYYNHNVRYNVKLQGDESLFASYIYISVDN